MNLRLVAQLEALSHGLSRCKCLISLLPNLQIVELSSIVNAGHNVPISGEFGSFCSRLLDSRGEQPICCFVSRSCPNLQPMQVFGMAIVPQLPQYFCFEAAGKEETPSERFS